MRPGTVTNPRTRLKKAIVSLGALSLLSVLAGCKTGTAGKVVSVSVDPTGVNIVIKTTQQFNATVLDTFNTAVTWKVAGGSANGTISTNGLYTAPATVPTPAQVVIIATSEKDTSKTGTATVTITTKSAPSNVTVQVSPSTASIASYSTQLFTATVAGSTNTNVTWFVNGQQGGSRTLGFISSSGFYVAPGNVPTTSDGNGGNVATTLNVTAVSQANTNATGSSTVTIVPGNQNTQTGPIELGTSGGNGNGLNRQCGGAHDHVLRRDAGFAGDARRHAIYFEQQSRAGEERHGGAGRSDRAAGIDRRGTDAGFEMRCDGGDDGGEFVAVRESGVGEFERRRRILTRRSRRLCRERSIRRGIFCFWAERRIRMACRCRARRMRAREFPRRLGLEVAKSGRSTGLTCSTVLSVSIDTSVEYNKSCDGTGAKFTVDYDNQVDVTGGDFAAEGDSGSLIVSQNTADPVALLYAGSDSDVVGNPVSQVLAFFSSGGKSDDVCGRRAARGDWVHVAERGAVGGPGCGCDGGEDAGGGAE